MKPFRIEVALLEVDITTSVLLENLSISLRKEINFKHGNVFDEVEIVNKLLIIVFRGIKIKNFKKLLTKNWKGFIEKIHDVFPKRNGIEQSVVFDCLSKMVKDNVNIRSEIVKEKIKEDLKNFEHERILIQNKVDLDLKLINEVIQKNQRV